MLLFSAMSYAQVELLHTFSREITIGYPIIEIPSLYSSPSNSYYYYESSNNVTTCYYYNADFTLEGTESHDYSICYTVPTELQAATSAAGFSNVYWKISLSNHLINTDDYYEYIVLLRRDSYEYYTYIINSQGELILDIGYTTAFPSVVFHNVNGQVRMCLTLEDYQDGHYQTYTQIYSCGGNATRITENSNINKKASDAYPNPATEYVNIPYELNEGETATIKIYDVNGKQIDQKQIGFHFNNIKLDVSNYRPGTYIYEYNGKANRFIVQ